MADFSFFFFALGWYSSDADSDVLADYVLALIRSDAPDDEIRRASIENLEDFLKERQSLKKKIPQSSSL